MSSIYVYTPAGEREGGGIRKFAIKKFKVLQIGEFLHRSSRLSKARGHVLNAGLRNGICITLCHYRDMLSLPSYCVIVVEVVSFYVLL